MSRHRNLRKVSIGDDDYDDDMAQSYDDKYSYAISPSTSEMYMFNRNRESQSISQFISNGQKIMEEDDEPEIEETQMEANNQKSPDAGTNQTQQSKIKSKVDEDFMFDMDKEPNFATQKKIEKPYETNFTSNPRRRDDLASHESHLSSPKSVKKQTPNKQASKQHEQTRGSRHQTNSEGSKTNIISSIHELKISDNSSKRVFNVVDREQLLKAYEEHTAGKDVINLIVVGHVDAGKSTLMGHLLFQLGQVSSKQMHKYKQESQKIGKSSFAFAWVLDETEEERSRGVTIDIAQTKFETDKKIINLLDAPGHKDFIPNMITGAGQADCAILVINSVKGEFETGFEQGGQTREHSLLIKSLGVSQLIIAVNKMDMCDWSKERFYEICKKLGSFLTKQVGFKENDIQFVPCSGLVGENLTKEPTSENLISWYNAKSLKEQTEFKNLPLPLTLVESINRFNPGEKPIDKPLRFCISDVFKGPQSSAISLAGKVEAGSVKTGDKICIIPSNENGTVKSISLTNDVPLTQCFAGDSVILNINNIDMSLINIGNFLCDCNAPPMPISDKLKAKIVLFNLELPFIKGFPVVFHYKSMNEAAVIKKIIAQLDKSNGEVVKEKPRFLSKGMSAIVEIKINRPLCMELFQDYRELGRFMLRYGSNTIAAGLITEIL